MTVGESLARPKVNALGSMFSVRFRDAGADPIITSEEMIVLEKNWRDWTHAESKARSHQCHFSTVSNRSFQTAQMYESMIRAGDEPYKKDH